MAESNTIACNGDEANIKPTEKHQATKLDCFIKALCDTKEFSAMLIVVLEAM